MFCHGSIFLQGSGPPSNPVRFSVARPRRWIRLEAGKQLGGVGARWSKREAGGARGASPASHVTSPAPSGNPARGTNGSGDRSQAGIVEPTVSWARGRRGGVAEEGGIAADDHADRVKSHQGGSAGSAWEVKSPLRQLSVSHSIGHGLHRSSPQICPQPVRERWGRCPATGAARTGPRLAVLGGRSRIGGASVLGERRRIHA